jgi:hypothetical protein
VEKILSFHPQIKNFHTQCSLIRVDNKIAASGGVTYRVLGTASASKPAQGKLSKTNHFKIQQRRKGAP